MKIIPYIRTKDVIFGSEKLEELFKIKKFPIFMGCTIQNENTEVFFSNPSKYNKLFHHNLYL